MLLVRTPAVPSRPRAVILCLHMMDRGEGRKLPSAFSCVRAQLCPILRDTMDGSPPGSSVRRIFQARILEWVAFPPPGDLPDPGIEPASPAASPLVDGFFSTEPS